MRFHSWLFAPVGRSPPLISVIDFRRAYASEEAPCWSLEHGQEQTPLSLLNTVIGMALKQVPGFCNAKNSLSPIAAGVIRRVALFSWWYLQRA